MGLPTRILCRPGRIACRFCAALLYLSVLSGCSEESAESPSDSAILFEETTSVSGVEFTALCGGAQKRHLLETLGCGLVVADLNGDGHLDLYLVNGGSFPLNPSPARINRLYFGDGQGRFRPGPLEDPASDRGFGVGAVAADYDRDGDLDLYLLNYGPNVLLRNKGDGTFEDVTTAAGVGDPRWSASAAFGDLDGDGLLDLYVANYLEFGNEASLKMPKREWAGLLVPPGPIGMTPHHDRIYRNRGDGTFEDVSQEAGILSEPARFSLAVTMSDVDDDGDLDVYVANDSMSNALWLNDGKGVLEDVGLDTGTSVSNEGHAQAGMGIAIEDFDRDGAWDIVVTNFSRDYNTFYGGRADDTFDDRTVVVGLSMPTWSELAFGVVGEDFDNDGWTDLFFANGHVFKEVNQGEESTYAQPNQVFRNRGDGTFVDMSSAAGNGVTALQVSRGLIAGDLDGDGRLDVVVSNLDGPVQILMNGSKASGHWLGVRLRGRKGRRDLTCVGARVTIEAQGRKWVREVRAGSSFASGGSGDLHFGLGAVTRIDRLTVRFPDGAKLERKALAVDQLIVLEAP